MTDLFSQIIGEQSTRWHAQFIDNLPVGVFRTTVEGRFVFCNRTMARLLGFSSVKELVEHPVVDLYSNTRDRGKLVQRIIKSGHVDQFLVDLQKIDKTPVRCALTVKAVLDDDGMVVFLDGVIREVSDETPKEVERKIPDSVKDFFVLLDLKGDRPEDETDKDNQTEPGPEPKTENWIGKPLMEFIVPGYRDLFALFLADVINTGRKEGLITLVDKDGTEQQINYQASLAGKRPVEHERVHDQDRQAETEQADSCGQDILNREKLEGIMEMAGGISHHLNQPLTIINNTLSEILSDPYQDNESYKKIVKVQSQINKISEMVRKIASIRKYEAMDYVAGIKIVDIDKAT